MAKASIYTQEIVDEICQRISEGEPLRQICRDEHMPAWRTVYEWKEKYADFAKSLAAARDLGFDAIAEEALIIADTPMEGIRTEQSKDGIKETREDMLGHRKLQIETRLKLLAKWSPKKYGERITNEHTGDLSIHDITDAELERRIAERIANTPAET